MESQKPSKKAGGKISKGKKAEGGEEKRCYIADSQEKEKSHKPGENPRRWKRKG